MKRIETTALIQKPLEEVFSYLIEPANFPEWAPGYVEAASTSPGPIRIGSSSTRVTDFGGRRAESEHTVTAYTPNQSISVTSRSGPFEIVEIFEVRLEGNVTRVTIAEEVSTPLLLKPLEWLFAIMAKQNINRYGTALKDQLDGGGG